LQCAEGKLLPPSMALDDINFPGRSSGMSGIQLPSGGR
jgi:hypothetical protein